MGWWSAYFFAKLLLYAGGHCGFSPWLNLPFAVFTALTPRNARQQFTKNLIAVPCGIALLYHDSWLPPIGRAVSQAGSIGAFSPSYLFELGLRFFDWRVLAELALMLMLYLIARRKLRLSTWVFIAMFAIMLAPARLTFWRDAVAGPGTATPAVAGIAAPQLDARYMRPQALSDWLAQFYARERQRQVHFAHAAANDPPFDIVLLHICSLSWDDLHAASSVDFSVLNRFQFVLSSFNSAASYSGPAAIRLLRGRCGTPPHNSLYDPPARDCLLIDGLQDAGFEPHWLMNHDGHFGNFFGDVRDHGAFPVAPDNPGNALIAQHSFDGSPVYSDYDVLSRWWSKRLANPASRMVLYYNSISLHDGNRSAVSGSSSYASRLAALNADINRFAADLERSGRRVVLIIVPEHGAALRGDRRQIPGLREIPTPAITHVPVGIALINAGSPPPSDKPLKVDAPTSYLALSEMLARFIADDPFVGGNADRVRYVRDLPQTESVAENEGTVMVQIGTQYMLRTPDGNWSPWDASPP